MRKRRPLTPARVRSLILGGRDLPEMTSVAETTVAHAIQRVRSRRKQWFWNVRWPGKRITL